MLRKNYISELYPGSFHKHLEILERIVPLNTVCADFLERGLVLDVNVMKLVAFLPDIFRTEFGRMDQLFFVGVSVGMNGATVVSGLLRLNRCICIASIV